MAAFIPGTSEFFIAARDLPEWKGAHVVFARIAPGDAASHAVVDAILALPYTNFTHPDYGTVMRMLVTRVPITPIAVERRDGGGGSG
jgi:cyclophilin family peptidyl-prolyl cis-trans isomerase